MINSRRLGWPVATAIALQMSVAGAAQDASFAAVEALSSPPPSAPPPQTTRVSREQPLAVQTRPTPPPPPRPAVRLDRTRKVLPKNQRGWMALILKAYPLSARGEQLEGTVHVTVTVDTTGRARECEVTQSSGHAILDEAACAGMLRYSRLHPALNAAGEPVTGSFSVQIPYLLEAKPEENLAPRVGFEPTTK